MHNEDQEWADLLSPTRRGLLRGGGLAAAFAVSGIASAQTAGKSPWGYDTYREATTQPRGVRPGEQTLPAKPRAYTDIKSYHAHVYFDEDTFQKAALLHKWTAERFEVELGNWNLEPRGPHVTPSFYFGFGNEQLQVIVPWRRRSSWKPEPGGIGDE